MFASCAPLPTAIRGAATVARLVPLSLTNNAIAEDAANTTVIGAILGGQAGSTITLVADAGGKFDLNSGNIRVAAALDYETATSHQITVRETNASYPNSPLDTNLAILVTNALEVTLGALNLDDLTHSPSDTQGTLVGSITGTTAGSTVTLYTQEVANAYQKDGSDIEVGSAGPLSAGERDITLRETHADASNSPRDTVITITSEAALGPELWAQPAFDASTNLTLGDWTVGSGTASSNAGGTFMLCTAADTLTTGTYRVVFEVTANAGSDELEIRVANGGTYDAFPGVGVHSSDVVVTAVNEQLIRVRDLGGGNITLTSLSVKKIG